MLLQEIGRKNNLPVEMSAKNVINCQNSNRCPTGCPTGAKQSVVFNYLKDATDGGARVLSGLRCMKIHHKHGRANGVTARDTHGRSVQISFSHLFMAAGVIQTPFLLRKSGVSKAAGRSIAFHVPLKFITIFDQVLNAADGTSSKTVLEEDGFKIATSNFRPEYVALSLISHGREAMNEALANLDKMAIFMSLLQTSSKAHLLTALLDQPIITSRITPLDMKYIGAAIQKTVKLLFSGGAKKIYLPIEGSKVVQNLGDLDHELHRLRAGSLEILTVHAMSSCPMGTSAKNSVVDLNGKVWGTENIYVADASVLPTSTGCGPQGTIMAAALMLARGFVSNQHQKTVAVSN
jgi:choline dehydrogenase-like flavoprotein